MQDFKNCTKTLRIFDLNITFFTFSCKRLINLIYLSLKLEQHKLGKKFHMKYISPCNFYYQQ